MKTFGTLFSGGELFGVGAVAAGYTPLWGIEKDDKIAKVARLNGFPVITGDVLSFDFTTLDRPNHIHASPPCPNYSRAKTGGEETELDIAMAESVCRALIHFKPDTFTLENVVGYRNGEGFKKIGRTLSDLGYWWDATNLNAADLGVPQTRERLWIRASRGLLMGYPPPVPWKGWYKAIEDLIPSLPDAEFAPWQMARLPEEYKTFMIGQGTYSAPKPEDEPADTITSNHNQGSIRAFVMQVQGENGKGYRESDEPMQTLAVGHTPGKYKAFIVGDQKGQMADSDRPAFTVRAGESGGTPPRAFVLDGQANDHGESVTIRDGEERLFTVSASGEKRPLRAFIVPGGNASSFSVRDGDEPARTVESANRTGNNPRAYVGRVVKLDIRCLGRFQTVPDSYQGLTVKINGNGVPCLEAKKVLETFP